MTCKSSQIETNLANVVKTINTDSFKTYFNLETSYGVLSLTPKPAFKKLFEILKTPEEQVQETVELIEQTQV